MKKYCVVMHENGAYSGTIENLDDTMCISVVCKGKAVTMLLMHFSTTYMLILFSLVAMGSSLLYANHICETEVLSILVFRVVFPYM